MQFKLWVFAVRAADVAFANRYQVLAHVHPFTISCWFTRRNPSSAPDIPLAWFDPVDVAKNTAVGQSKGIVFIRSLAESRSTPPAGRYRGVVGRRNPNFLKQNRLAR
jgi:hypothetical protein